MVKITVVLMVGPGSVRWNNTSSLLTSHMSPIRVGIIVLPDIASVYVIDVLVHKDHNVTSSGLVIKFYFDIQNAMLY